MLNFIVSGRKNTMMAVSAALFVIVLCFCSIYESEAVSKYRLMPNADSILSDQTGQVLSREKRSTTDRRYRTFVKPARTYALAKPDQYYNQFEDRVVDRDTASHDFRSHLPSRQKLNEYTLDFDETIEEPPQIKEEPYESQAQTQNNDRSANGRRGSRVRGSRTKVLKIGLPSSLRLLSLISKQEDELTDIAEEKIYQIKDMLQKAENSLEEKSWNINKRFKELKTRLASAEKRVIADKLIAENAVKTAEQRSPNEPASEIPGANIREPIPEDSEEIPTISASPEQPSIEAAQPQAVDLLPANESAEQVPSEASESRDNLERENEAVGPILVIDAPEETEFMSSEPETEPSAQIPEDAAIQAEVQEPEPVSVPEPEVSQQADESIESETSAGRAEQEVEAGNQEEIVQEVNQNDEAQTEPEVSYQAASAESEIREESSQPVYEETETVAESERAEPIRSIESEAIHDDFVESQRESNTELELASQSEVEEEIKQQFDSENVPVEPDQPVEVEDQASRVDEEEVQPEASQEIVEDRDRFDPEPSQNESTQAETREEASQESELVYQNESSSPEEQPIVEEAAESEAIESEPVPVERFAVPEEAVSEAVPSDNLEQPEGESVEQEARPEYEQLRGEADVNSEPIYEETSEREAENYGLPPQADSAPAEIQEVEQQEFEPIPEPQAVEFDRQPVESAPSADLAEQEATSEAQIESRPEDASEENEPVLQENQKVYESAPDQPYLEAHSRQNAEQSTSDAHSQEAVGDNQPEFIAKRDEMAEDAVQEASVVEAELQTEPVVESVQSPEIAEPEAVQEKSEQDALSVAESAELASEIEEEKAAFLPEPTEQEPIGQQAELEAERVEEASEQVEQEQAGFEPENNHAPIQEEEELPAAEEPRDIQESTELEPSSPIEPAEAEVSYIEPVQEAVEQKPVEAQEELDKQENHAVSEPTEPEQSETENESSENEEEESESRVKTNGFVESPVTEEPVFQTIRPNEEHAQEVQVPVVVDQPVQAENGPRHEDSHVAHPYNAAIQNAENIKEIEVRSDPSTHSSVAEVEESEHEHEHEHEHDMEDEEDDDYFDHESAEDEEDDAAAYYSQMPMPYYYRNDRVPIDDLHYYRLLNLRIDPAFSHHHPEPIFIHHVRPDAEPVLTMHEEEEDDEHDEDYEEYEDEEEEESEDHDTQLHLYISNDSSKSKTDQIIRLSASKHPIIIEHDHRQHHEDEDEEGEEEEDQTLHFVNESDLE